MILGGDEIMRTQLGNNNAYCQDNETGWYDWDLDERRQKMREFVRRCISIRMRYSVLRRREFQRGATITGTNAKDITWLNADGSEIRQEQWNGASLRALGVLLTRTERDLPDAPASKAHSEDIMIIYNPTDNVIEFSLPARWRSQEIIIDSIPGHHDAFPIPVGSKKISVEASSICMLREIT